jgi:hypothetical protein
VPVGWLILGLLVVSCGSSHKDISSGAPVITTANNSTMVTSPLVSTTPTTVAGQLPTVPDCGAGAFEPTTLLIVCGNSSTMATGLHWSSWTQGSAAGSGTVQLTVAGRPASQGAHVALTDVVSGESGPQYTELTVTWTGPSPTGHPVDTFRLAAASG